LSTQSNKPTTFASTEEEEEEGKRERESEKTHPTPPKMKEAIKAKMGEFKELMTAIYANGLLRLFLIIDRDGCDHKHIRAGDDAVLMPLSPSAPTTSLA